MGNLIILIPMFLILFYLFIGFCLASYRFLKTPILDIFQEAVEKREDLFGDSASYNTLKNLYFWYMTGCWIFVYWPQILNNQLLLRFEENLNKAIKERKGGSPGSEEKYIIELAKIL